MMNKRKTILYVGNFLMKHGTTPTFNAFLTPRLQEGYDVITTSSKKNKVFRLLDMVWCLIANRKKTDIVLMDVYSTSAFWFAYVIALLARMFGLPYVPILHGGNLPARLKNSPGLCKTLFGKAKINASPSVYLELAFKEAGFNVAYVPNFVEIEKYQFKHRAAASPKILWVRSLHKIYNPTLAIKALKILHDRGIAANLCMVGPDKDGSRQEVEDLAKSLGMDKFLTFTGVLPVEKWLALSADYDIFINTTNFDNLPVSIIEAMALGFPIVSTNVGGLPYLIEDGKDGLLVPPDDAEAFANKIELLLTTPGLAAKLSTNARAKAETFAWQSIKEKWARVIES